MEKNFYEILELDENLLPYFLKTDQAGDIESGAEYRNQKIREAYEKKKKKIQEECKQKIEELKNERNLSLGMKKFVIKNKKTFKRLREKNEIALEEEEEKFKKRAMHIIDEYQLKMKELDAVYESVKTEELRQKYNMAINNPDKEKLYIEYMREITNEIEQEIREKNIKEKYSKADKYQPELINTIGKGKYQGEKLVLRKSSKDPIIISLSDERQTKIKCTGTIHFANFMGCQSYVNEYQIARVLDNQQKIDTVYTILELPKLAFNKDNKPSNPHYYDCIVNKLLSEEAIEGSKYNGGYVGLVERSKSGYDITIDKKLSEEEEENLTAVMLWKEAEEKRKKISTHRKGEDR